jgi:hypothetical protein
VEPPGRVVSHLQVAAMWEVARLGRTSPEVGKAHGFIKEIVILVNRMEYIYFTEPTTFCIIKNYQSNEVTKSILKELDALKPHLKGPADTAAARDLSGEIKKVNSGLFLENFLGENAGKSGILNYGRKLFNECIWELKKSGWFYKYIERSNHNSTLVSYYKSGDFYESHEDSSIVTAIYYIWKDPKSFEGGDLYFGDFKVPIENNCLLIFPSCVEHRVTPVIGEGRWAITQFMNSNPVNPNQDIVLFDNFLHVADFAEVTRKVDCGSWKYSNTSNFNSAKKFFMMELDEDKFFSEYIKGAIEARSGKKFKLLRVYANGQVYGQDGDFHQDDPGPNTWTFLIYMNIVPANELENWGGETQFKMNDGLKIQLPLPNTGVLFRSNIFHRGMAPTSPSSGLRVTVAWKLEEWIS